MASLFCPGGGVHMATVTSTLKMMDAMTRPLQNITQGMNMMKIGRAHV